MGLLLISLAGCTAYDVASILERMREDLRELEIKVEGYRRKDPLKIYTEIKLTYIVHGNVSENNVKRQLNFQRRSTVQFQQC
ncbi:MAG: OsmC family protein [Candidatus Verstraetearchaeota archaeon]|nr:OsmC family protein [Candidatus Verstraetearchaeota archaeon]